MAIVLIIALSSILASIITLSESTTSFSDRLTETGDIIAGATLLLAVVAAVVALMAYAVSTGLPDLKVQIQFEFSYLNRPVFRAEIDENGDLRAARFKQTICTIMVRNDSSYSARSPAIIVRLRGMAFNGEIERLQERGWVITNFANTQGVTEVQWDGGANYSIHGNSVRKLPLLDLANLHKVASWPDPQITVELLSDGGYRKETAFYVDFTVNGQSQFPQNTNSEEDRIAWH